jgi:hypothetical protein
MKTSWFENGHEYHYGEVSNQVDKLPVGIFNIKENPRTGKLYLCKVENEFKFNHKIYGLEKDFIQRVKRTYDSVQDNLGLLLTGIKGTGKSVTAKLICNLMNLPIIVVDGKYDGLPSFISELQQNVVIFIDEYEKIYKEDADVLTVMDGIFKSEYKHVFLLTTNDLYINRNMLQRPGRIRYVKTYEDLTQDVVEEIIDDLLINKSHKDDCIKSISKLQIITVDLVKSIIQEVNIHDEAPSKFMDFFNVKGSSSTYSADTQVVMYKVKDSVITKEVYADNICIDSIKSLRIGSNIYWADVFYGRVVEKFPNNVFKLSVGYNEPDFDDYDENGKFIVDNYDDNELLQKDGKYYIKTSSNKPDFTEYYMVHIKEVPQTHLNYKVPFSMVY